VIWNVIGSVIFEEEQVPQWYLIENEQWSANVSHTQFHLACKLPLTKRSQ
jgi:hypothetical protein